MDHFEDHLHTVWTEWGTLREKWFKGEMMDPVFEGVVRDFCIFDDTMHNIHGTVTTFMKGIDQLGIGMVALSDGVSQGLAHASDSHIASDTCKLKEATNSIIRADAPHSAVAKLRRDMTFNIITPVQNHIANNRNLKVSLDVRRRRLVELNTVKKQYDDVVKKNLASHDKRFLTARANLEAAKMTFNDVDRHVFEWLYILEEYRGDILDSTLQTLKYLQYEFFASSAHAISMVLPTRMEFRPMVEMTPRHLEAQVEMELRESEELVEDGNKDVTDFSTRLIDKKARDDPGEELPQLPVDPLSLSSLLSQGFEEGPARRALRMHQNNTQDALDWLINGANEMAEKQKQMTEGVRLPTTVKRVQKLKAMRRELAEKKAQQKRREEGVAEEEDSGSSDAGQHGQEGRPQAQAAQAAEASQPRPTPPPQDLLSLDDQPAVPTDFSKSVERAPLPPQISFEDISMKCELPPLAAAVAAGLAQPRSGPPADLTDAFTTPAVVAALAPAVHPAASPAPALEAGQAFVLAGLPADLAATVQALAAQSELSPELLIQAARQLQAQAAAAAAAATSATPPSAAAPHASLAAALGGCGGASASSGVAPCGGGAGAALGGGAPSAPSGWDALGGTMAGMSVAASPSLSGGGGIAASPGSVEALDPFSGCSGGPSGYAAATPQPAALAIPAAAAAAATTAATAPQDHFGDLFGMAGGSNGPS